MIIPLDSSFIINQNCDDDLALYILSAGTLGFKCPLLVSILI